MDGRLRSAQLRFPIAALFALRHDRSSDYPLNCTPLSADEITLPLPSLSGADSYGGFGVVTARGPAGVKAAIAELHGM
jgi:hypothetical protein